MDEHGSLVRWCLVIIACAVVLGVVILGVMLRDNRRKHEVEYKQVVLDGMRDQNDRLRRQLNDLMRSTP